MSRTPGYAYVVCMGTGCDERRYERTEEQPALDRWAAKHTETTGHPTIAGLRVMGSRPRICPECKATGVCTRECTLAPLMAWPAA